MRPQGTLLGFQKPKEEQAAKQRLSPAELPSEAGGLGNADSRLVKLAGSVYKTEQMNSSLPRNSIPR